MTRYGVHAGTEGASIQEVVAFWRRVEALGYGWLSIWDRFSPMLGGGWGPLRRSPPTPRWPA
jgi:hypothetical protein